MNETGEFILKWKKNNHYFKKIMKREDAMATFEGLIKGFNNNNMVSQKLAEIIPKASEIKINWDNTAEVNQVYYTLDEKQYGLPIINAHNIVWAVWNGYCMNGEEIKPEEFK